MYRAPNVPASPDDLPAFLVQETRNIEKAFSDPSNFVLVAISHKEPEKIRDGMIVLADGADWNPGSGAGFYYYLASAWNFLG